MDVVDLLVLGGGITGAGVARLAARHGLAVELIERGDLASGASSASSHMLHGGLRYLEHGHLPMVREALHERAAVLRMAGPLAVTQRFLVPCRRGARVPPWKLRAGLALYDLLAGSRTLERHSWVDARTALDLEPVLESRGLLGAGLYSDAVVDDARLTVAVARDAAAHGARIHTWTELESVARSGDGIEARLRDRIDGGERVVRARLIVNATGAWCDGVRARLLPQLGGAAMIAPLLGPSRGSHLIYARQTMRALLLLAASDGRVFFVVPFGNRSLVGTTEVTVSSPPDGEVAASGEEIRYLAAEMRRALPGCSARPLARTSGVRPLLRSGGALGAAPREHRVVVEGLLLTIAGGKLTTFRVMARDVLRAALRSLGRQGQVADSDDPLPAPFEASGSHEDLGAFAVREEFARTLEDVLRRRTRAWLAPDRGRGIARPVAMAMAKELSWSAARIDQELAGWERTLADEERDLAAAREDG
jgi:glycerol-3-phosphate dehydrogenase